MEIWKNVVGYEGFYEVSSYGRVRSVDRVNYRRHLKGKMLSQAPGGRDGKYKTVQLFDTAGKCKHKYVHQLVAEAFIGKAPDGFQVNHKDENKSNNCASNLEWVTASQNINYGTRHERDAAHKNKQVEQISLNGELICSFKSATEAQRKTGIWRTHISACCLGKQQTAGGYKWRFSQ